MPKQLNQVQIDLMFNANANQAKKEIESLNALLQKAMKESLNTGELGLNKELSTAVKTASQLQTALKNATNQDTGRLDLGEFNNNLKKAGLNLDTCKTQLSNLGVAGEQAFLKIAQSVSTASIPVKRTNALLNEFATTLKNTARWQISSSVLHSFMGSLQHAYGYAKDLNESLNSIRIVTGQTTDQMAEFAKKANESAKALSTTTTAYTDAALIFYQQGLGDDEVQKRTDATIKMANVTGDASREVSSYMTAIWNNFAKGSDNLDLFGDKITALGAETASSSAEIADGLEKFAAIGNTIGLSYDYATSALATVVATTRQSADSVGTAFKTIFARLQGLSLGESLEDGTDLNKYSKALAAAGIQIKEQGGELKKTDQILNEMAAKWKTMNQDQKVALAQTVAGVRQYTQLVALMDNWDFMEKNLDVVANAEGTLDRQAEIYAESWEAAIKRVETSAQGIYSKLIDDDFFIDLNNSLAKFIDLIDGLIDGLGGLRGVLLAVGALGTRIFAKDIAAGFDRLQYNFLNFSKAGRAAIEDTRQSWTRAAKEMIQDSSYMNIAETSTWEAKTKLQEAMINLQEKYIRQGKELPEDAKNYYSQLVMITGELGKQYEQSYKNAQVAEKNTKKLKESFLSNSTDIKNANGNAVINTKNTGEIDRGSKDKNGKFHGPYEDLKNLTNNVESIQKKWGVAASFIDIYNERIEKLGELSKKTSESDIENFKNKIAELEKELSNFNAPEELEQEINNLKNALKEIVDSGDIDKFSQVENKFNEINNVLKESEKEFRLAKNDIDNYNESHNIVGDSAEKVKNKILEIGEAAYQEGIAATNAAADNASLTTAIDGMVIALQKAGTAIVSFGDSMAKLMQGLSSIAMAISSLQGINDIINDDTLSDSEKFTKVITTLGFALPMLITGLKSFNVESLLAFSNSIRTALGMATLEASEIGVGTASGVAAAGLWSLIWPLGLLVGAIALAVAAWKGYQKAIERMEAASPEGQLKAAEEQANKTAEAFDRVKESVDESTNSVNNLKDAVEKLGDADVGSLGWHEELTKANEEINSLLSKYNNADLDLEQYITRGKNGSLDINEQFYKIIEQEQVKRLNAANLSKSLSQSNVNDKQKIVAQDSIDKYRINDKDYTNTGLGGYYANRQILEDANNFKITHSNDQIRDNDIINALDRYYKNNKEDGLDNLAQTLYDSKKDNAEYSDIDLNGLKKRVNELDKKYENYDAEIKRLDKENAELSVRQAEYAISAIGSNRDLEYFGLEKGLGDIVSKSNEKAKTIMQDKNPNAPWVEDVLKNLGYDKNQIEDGSLSFDAEGELSFKLKENPNNKPEKIANDILESTITAIETNKSLDETFNNTLNKKISNAFNNIGSLNLDGMSQEVKVSIDNALQSIESVVGENNLSKVLTDDLLKAIDGKDLDEKSANFADFINAIDLQDPEKFNTFSQAVQDFTNSIDPNKVTVFTNELKELKAATDIDNMGSFFKDAASKYGFSKDDAAEMQQYAKHLMELADTSDDLDDSLDTSAESAAALSVSIFRMNKGIEQLANGFEDWSDILKKSTKESQEYFEALNKMKEALANVLDVDIDSLSNGFFESAENLKLIEQAATGSAEAIDQLRILAAQDYLINFSIQNNLGEELQNDLLNQLQSIQDMIPDIEVGAVLDGTGSFEQACLDLIQSAGMTVEQANAMFDHLGFDANFEELEKTVVSQKPVIRTITEDHSTTVSDGNWGQRSLTDTRTYSYVEGFRPVTEKVMIPAISTNDNKPAFKLTKKAAGSSNNYSGSNSGGKAPGKSSKGGGGSSKKETKDTKQYKDEFDIYHDLQRAIDETADSISDLNRVQSHLFGPELANNLKQESKLLEKQAKNYKALAEAQKSQMGLMQEDLKKYGFAFNAASGEIVNYAAITLKMLDEYNKAIAAYNASAQDETAKAALESAEKRYEEFKKILDLYESTLDNHRDAVNEAEQKAIDAIGKNLEAFTVEIEFKIDTKELEIAIKKFNQSLEEDFQKHFKNIKAEIEGIADILPDKQAQINTRQSKMMEYQSEMKLWQSGQLDGADLSQYAGQLLFTSRSEAENAYRKAQKEYMDAVEDFKSTVVDAWDKYLDGIDQVMEHFNDFMDRFDDINDVLKNQVDIIQLLYGEDSYDRLGMAYDTLQANSLAKMEAVRRELGVWQDFYNSIEDKDNEDAVKALEKIRELQGQINNEIVDYLNTITNKYTNTISKIFKDLDKGISGGKGTNWIKTQWDDAKYAAEGYYDDVQRITELSKLRNKFEQAVDDAKGLRGQQKLKELLDQQMGILEDKSKLSEYDVTLAEKRLAVLQAQIALEESQNNKNSMKLTRDQSGNWSYNYVVDQDNVRDKENDLLNASSDYYDFTKESWANMTEEIWGDIETMQERLSKLMEEYKYADEDRRAQIEEQINYIKDYYLGENGIVANKVKELEDYETNLNIATFETLKSLYDVDEYNYTLMTDKEKELADLLRNGILDNYDAILIKTTEVNEESINLWNTTAEEVIRLWNGGTDSIRGQVEEALALCGDAQREFDEAVKRGEEASGIAYSNTTAIMEEQRRKINELSSDHSRYVSQATSELSSLQSAIRSVIDMYNQMAAAARAAMAAEAAAKSVTATSSGGGGSVPSSTSSSGSTGGSGGTGGGSSALNNNPNKSPSNPNSKTYIVRGYTENKNGLRTNEEILYQGTDLSKAKQVYNTYEDLMIEQRTKYNKLLKSGFYTGGYTGSWSDGGVDEKNGRMAILHQKELVLNASDTKNMLEAVNIVRDISSIGSSISNAIANGISGIIGQIVNNDNIKNYSTNNSNTFGDNVFNITAEFPNADDVTSIREAILGLPNLASQYLGRR